MEPVNWKRTDDARCPSCNNLEEDAGHLIVCRCPDRSRLFEENVVIIEEWMKSHFTHPLLRLLVSQYLRGRVQRKFRNLEAYTPRVKSLAAAQDKIGWRHFTEGKLAWHFRQIQRSHLHIYPTRLTVNSWLKGFVGKLLEMTHAQWIFRCITKHHQTKGTIVLKANEDLLQEIERLLSIDVDNVSEDNRWMLELDVEQLSLFSVAEKQFWIHAVEAARQASTRAIELSEGATNNWNNIIKDKKYKFVHSTTKPSQDSSAPATTLISLQETDKATSLKQAREIAHPDSKKTRLPTKPKAGHKNKPRKLETQPAKSIASKLNSTDAPRLRAGYSSLVPARPSRGVHFS